MVAFITKVVRSEVDKFEGCLQGKMTGPGNELTGIRVERELGREWHPR